jgi:2-polyprenyl-6-methoxyphenol hydroxylase-like FAD-dependent oxidoreductase
MPNHDGSNHAVVLGASVAGMCAAAALARSMERVTVVERDHLPTGRRWRRGVPQSRHAHNLMTAGQQAMEWLFPGIREQLVRAGMVPVRMPQDMLLLTPGGWMPRFPSDVAMLTGNREVIDAELRDRLRADPKVTFLERSEAVGLIPGRQDCVTGVRVRTRNSDGTLGWGPVEDLPAEFTVDATGRTSQAGQWLAELGYGTPQETVVDAQTAYATCIFAPPLGHSADWTCMLLQATKEVPRQGILNPMGGGCWMVSIAASGGRRPPNDHDGFLEFAKELRSPVLFEAIRDANPLTSVYRSGRTENRWRHYERMRRWPDQFLVMGDATAALNPSYGQGMSVSAPSALVIEDVLRRTGTTVGAVYRMRREIAKKIAPAWQLATAVDLGYPWAAEVSPPGLSVRLGQAYVNRVVAAAPRSVAASKALIDLSQLTASPAAVFRPAVLAAALRGGPGTVAAEPPAAPPGTSRVTVSQGNANVIRMPEPDATSYRQEVQG